MSEEAAAAAAAAREVEQAKYKATCDKYVENGLKSNVTVQFLLERLMSMGCKPPEGFIRCVDCGDTMAGGGFGVVEETVVLSHKKDNTANVAVGAAAANVDQSKLQKEVQARAAKEQCQQSVQDLKDMMKEQTSGKTQLRLLPEIFLCQQHLRNQTHAHESMVHELIHAIDMCRTKMDPLNNCVQLACTEIRAENLSGECNWMQELGAGRVEKFAGHGELCIKRRAGLSVKANPNCADRAQDYVDAAFDRCHKDTFPFDRHPNLR